jgi:hypothetical protein
MAHDLPDPTHEAQGPTPGGQHPAARVSAQEIADAARYRHKVEPVPRNQRRKIGKGRERDMMTGFLEPNSQGDVGLHVTP